MQPYPGITDPSMTLLGPTISKQRHVTLCFLFSFSVSYLPSSARTVNKAHIVTRKPQPRLQVSAWKANSSPSEI